MLCARFVLADLSAAILAFLCTCAFASTAHADYPRDRAARVMIDKAINEHYLRTEFDRAESVLTGTILACEEKCSPLTVARAWMYVGIVRSSGKSDGEGAEEAFSNALALAPTVELDSDLATSETRQTWDRAQPAPAPPPISPRTTPATPAPTPPPSDRELCPPGLPGCARAGDRCETSRDCQAALTCQPTKISGRSICEAPATCDTDADCVIGSCSKGLCAAKRPPTEPRPHNNSIGLSGALDFAQLPEQRDACGVIQYPSRYQCYDQAGPYDGASTGRESPAIHSGFVRSTLRVLLSFEHAFGSDLRAGGRLGFAFLGVAPDFFPAHIELRLSYAPRALRAGRTLAPYVFASGGIAQVDARFPLRVDTADAGDAASYRELDAVAAFGRNFGAGGAGLRIRTGDDLELDFSLAALALFPDFGLVLQPSAGVVLGL